MSDPLSMPPAFAVLPPIEMSQTTLASCWRFNSFRHRSNKTPSNSSCVFKTAIGYRFVCLQATVFLLVAVGVSVKADNINVSPKGFSRFHSNAIRLPPLLKRLFFSAQLSYWRAKSSLNSLEKLGVDKWQYPLFWFLLYSDILSRYNHNH